MKSFPLKDTSGSHTSTHAHGNYAGFLLSSLELVEKCGDHPGSCHTHRVPKRYSASAPVQFGIWNLQFFHAVGRLAGECFVDLPAVDVGNLEAASFQGFWNSDCWTNAHDLRWYTSNGKAQDSAFNRKSESFRGRSLGHEDNRSTIRSLTGVTSGTGATFLKRWFQLSKRLQSGLRPKTIVPIDEHFLGVPIFILYGRCVRSYLLLGPPHFVRMCSLLMRFERHLVLLSSCDAELFNDIF